MADDRIEPKPSLLATEFATWCDALEAELDATDEGAPAPPETAPPPELKERILWQIRGQADEATSAPPRRVSAGMPDRGLATMAWALGVAASFMLAAAFAALWYATRTDLGATRRNVAQLEAMLHDRDGALQAKEAELAWLKDPRVQVALLKGLESNPTAKAKLLWHPGTKQGILWVSGLPPLPLEQSYELWAFVDDQPVPAGTFDARPDGATVIPISKQENLGETPVKFAVSIEPKGGVPKPTGAIVLVGERF
ncbi:MAG TPA: anti-sigma factor [Thermoanaerobaculia bacterium]|nr:anti-sigma factor [Thermoanaerobaculia bacterium]